MIMPGLYEFSGRPGKAEIEFSIFPEQTDHAPLEIDITDRYGNRPVRISFDPDGKLWQMMAARK